MPHDLRVITYDEVVAGARQHFLRRSTIDMDELAHELAVSRATLYRAVDGRDRLLGDVLWSLAERIFARARHGLDRSGIDAILEVSRRFTEEVMSAEPFRLFLEREPQTALRVLLTPAGGVHARTVAMQRADLCRGAQSREDGAAGRPRQPRLPLRPPAGVDPLRRHHERPPARPRLAERASSRPAHDTLLIGA